MAKTILFSESFYSEIVNNSELDNYIIELLDKAVKDKNVDFRSNVNGIQTGNILTKKVVEFFSTQVQNAMHAFEVKNSTPICTAAWINKNMKNSYNNVHTHPQSHFAIVYYCKAPRNSGGLIFRRNDQTVEMQMYDEHFKSTDSFNKFAIVPEKGLFVLFPSHLQHYVSLNNTDEERISLSCNIQLKKNG